MASLEPELRLEEDEVYRIDDDDNDSYNVRQRVGMAKYTLGFLPQADDKSIVLDCLEGFRGKNVNLTAMFAVNIVGELPSPLGVHSN